VNLPIGNTQAAKKWINKLSTNTPFLYVYKANLEAFIDWQQAEMYLKHREIRTLRNTAINRKLRSKKTVQLKVINTNIYPA
jgi:hypothetical protein